MRPHVVGAALALMLLPAAAPAVAAQPTGTAAASRSALEAAFKAGNDALAAKRYDVAIAAFDRALALSERPALLTNKAMALRLRGVDRYNAAVTSGNAARKDAGTKAAHRDWTASVAASGRSLELASAELAGVPEAQSAVFRNARNVARREFAEGMWIIATKVDPSRAEEAFRAYSAVAAAEDDRASRVRLAVRAARIFFESGAVQRAVTEFRQILTLDPGHAEANYYLAASLFALNTGLQESADRFAIAAAALPASDERKKLAVDTLHHLRTENKILPRMRNDGAAVRATEFSLLGLRLGVDDLQTVRARLGPGGSAFANAPGDRAQDRHLTLSSRLVPGVAAQSTDVAFEFRGVGADAILTDIIVIYPAGILRLMHERAAALTKLYGPSDRPPSTAYHKLVRGAEIILYYDNRTFQLHEHYRVANGADGATP